MKLELLTGDDAGELVDLHDGFVVGRAREGDLVVEDDSDVSRAHARFDLDGDRTTVTDLDSRNGTIVNGEPITTHTLSDGDEIHIGGLGLRYCETHTPWEDSVLAPPITAGHKDVLTGLIGDPINGALFVLLLVVTFLVASELTEVLLLVEAKLTG